MAEKVLITQFPQYINKEVNINGWVNNKRSSGSIIFLQLRDGYSTIQAVASKNDISQELFQQLDKLTAESSVSITGKVKEEPRSPTGFELQITHGKILCQTPRIILFKRKETEVSIVSNSYSTIDIYTLELHVNGNFKDKELYY